MDYLYLLLHDFSAITNIIIYMVFKQEPFVGYNGLPGVGLEAEDLKKVQRFWPNQFIDVLEKHSDFISVCPSKIPSLDTICFFIAKFKKIIC